MAFAKAACALLFLAPAGCYGPQDGFIRLRQPTKLYFASEPTALLACEVLENDAAPLGHGLTLLLKPGEAHRVRREINSGHFGLADRSRYVDANDWTRRVSGLSHEAIMMLVPTDLPRNELAKWLLGVDPLVIGFAGEARGAAPHPSGEGTAYHADRLYLSHPGAGGALVEGVAFAEPIPWLAAGEGDEREEYEGVTVVRFARPRPLREVAPALFPVPTAEEMGAGDLERVEAEEE